jgi:hypothetical protein
MARISHQIFENKERRLAPGAMLRKGYDNLRAGIARRLGLPADAPSGSRNENGDFADGVRHGAQDGAQHGQRNGHQDGKQDGFQGGGLNGNQDGQCHGKQQAAPNGKSSGVHDGAKDGASHGTPTPLEQELGVEFHVVDGVVLAFCAGDLPPSTAYDHAETLLNWLQGQEQFEGNEVLSKMLEHLLYPHLAKQMGWKPYAWRTVATYFANLPGVRRRQVDRRSGIGRVGPTPVVYYIPFSDL